MERKLKVAEFNKKEDLVNYVNQSAEEMEIVSISSSQTAVTKRHFLWYYSK